MTKLLKKKKISLHLALFLGSSVLSLAGFETQASSFYSNSDAGLTIKANKLVTAYLLIDKISQLNQYIEDLNKINKPNFNRIIFSFVKPTLTEYTSGDLANTGILGYFDKNDEDGKSREAFNLLQEAVSLSRQKNIQTFLSVGGWNYSCNDQISGVNCGAADDQYDYFPDPNDPQEAEKAHLSYANLVKLANDLGVQGIDFDYEEFWHADKYAVSWGPSASGDWSTTIANAILAAGGPSYDNLMQYGSTGSGAAFVMPKTVNKVAAILHEIADNPAAKDLQFATAAPPVGARPITGFVYGDNHPDIYEKGGVWWKGNLKGLWYNLVSKDKEIASRFDSLGLMTYDLCGDNAQMCAPYGGAALDLASQVSAYMKDYATWLKTSDTEANLAVSNIGKVSFLPAKYKLATKMQFGFEVNKPSFPQHASGQLQLTNQLVSTILEQQKNSDGVIIWQLYSKQNKGVADSTTINYSLQKSCETFLAGDDRYDCKADFPSSVKKTKNVN
jgi:chitinase